MEVWPCILPKKLVTLKPEARNPKPETVHRVFCTIALELLLYSAPGTWLDHHPAHLQRNLIRYIGTISGIYKGHVGEYD